MIGLARGRAPHSVDDDEPTIALIGSEDAYEIPADFEVDAAFDLDPNSWGTDPLVRTQVRVSPDHVHAFLAERLPFLGIPAVIGSAHRAVRDLAEA